MMTSKKIIIVSSGNQGTILSLEILQAKKRHENVHIWHFRQLSDHKLVKTFWVTQDWARRWYAAPRRFILNSTLSRKNKTKQSLLFLFWHRRFIPNF